MNYFNGRFDIMEASYHDDTHLKMVGTIVDNTGVYFASDAKVGDIIYVDGAYVGLSLLRYKITEINTNETSGADLSAIVEWDMPVGDCVEPFAGMDAIIGGLHSNGLTATITPKDYNSANEILVANANSYQSMLLGNNSGGGGTSPDLTEVNKKIKALEDKVETVQLEWEDIIRLSFEE